MKQNSNFWLLFLGRLVSRLGDAIFTAAAGYFVLEVTGSPIHMASVMAIMMISMLIAGPFAGNIVDQFKKVKLLYWMDYIRGFVVVATGLLIVFVDNQTVVVVALYIMSAIVGLCTVIFNPASSAAIPLMMKKEDLMKANSYMAITGSVTNIIGIALGAVIYALVGPAMLFIIDGSSYLLSGISEMFITIDEPDRMKSQTSSPWKDQMTMFKEGVNYLRAKKGLIFIGLFAAVLNFTLLPTFRVYQTQLIEETLGKEIIYLSIIMIAVSSGTTVGSIMLAGNEKIHKNSGIIRLLQRYTYILIAMIGVLGVIVHGVVQQSISFNWFMFFYCIVGFVVGLVVAGVNIPIETYIQKNTEPSKMGRVNGAVNMLAMMTNPLGLVLGGILVSYISVQYAYGISTLVLLVTSSMLLFRKELKDEDKGETIKKELVEEV